MTLAELNALDARAFASALDGVFEHSPWIVERTSKSRPFESVAALHRALIDTLGQASEAEQLGSVRRIASHCFTTHPLGQPSKASRSRSFRTSGVVASRSRWRGTR